jgi:hypothetical protein
LVPLTLEQDLFSKLVAALAGDIKVVTKIIEENRATNLSTFFILKEYSCTLTFVTENFGQTIYT